MSEPAPKSPLVNLAAHIVATVKCCNTVTEEHNNRVDNNTGVVTIGASNTDKSEDFVVESVDREAEV